LEKDLIVNKFKKVNAAIIYKLLIKTCHIDNRVIGRIWNYCWNYFVKNVNGDTYIKIHGTRVKVNIGYTYPIYSKRFKYLNSPLVELVYQVGVKKARPITLIDVGAAIGDTAFLVLDKCDNLIENIICLDGDEEFSQYLISNTNENAKIQVIISMLSEDDGETKSLTRIHSGTASAQGDKLVKSNTLDHLMERADPKNIDVLKIDVDGFDGLVLKGSRVLISKFKPAIIFEWHPKLCIETGNNYIDHFSVLINLEYDRFLWYNKYGYFSFFTDSHFDLERIAELSKNSVNDWHYDVVSLHKSDPINIQNLVDMRFTHLGLK
jgi:FkbM family methyltransferase